MKKIGVISDVHGNIVALREILKYFDANGCGEIIHTGDVVDIGPRSRECLELLLSRGDVTLLLGNHDRDFARNDYAAQKLSHVPTEHKLQVFGAMDEALRDKVKSFPLYVTRRCGRDTLLFTHYALAENPDGGYPFLPIATDPTAEVFDEMFARWECEAVFFGHKHEPCDITGNKLYVDVGSVGCYPEPYARGIIISYDDAEWSYRRVAVPYDMELTRRQMDGVAAGKQLYDFYFLRRTPKEERK